MKHSYRLRTACSLAIAATLVFSAPLVVKAANVKDLVNNQAAKWQGSIIDVGPLRKFYKSRRGKGIWTDARGLNRQGTALVSLLAKASADGLETSDYLRKLPGKIPENELPGLELYLSQAFWKFGRDLYAGRTTPAVSEPDIVINRKKIDITGWLNEAGRRGPQKVIDKLRPSHLQYEALRAQLANAKGKKARKIIVNMERWRWLPRELGKRHVLVNQAAFEMYIREKGKIVDRRRVVVGKPYYKTPMFSYAIKYAEFNPTWTIPKSIASDDYLPKLRANPRYLEKRGYKIYSSWDKDAPELDVTTVNWRGVSGKDFPYKIVQQSGKKNALGKVKFMFPNRFSVYLHDTPTKKLFSNSSRAFSRGCIRVQNPVDFAVKLFKPQRLSESKINKILATEKTTQVKMRKEVPIHLTYFTLWVEGNGKMNSYKDVYKRDVLVGRILFGGA
ncbi:MAG: L,D-transpeptidase family protein [Rhizobiaceae bacterium]|nr:L,D-transpeptidase family protein [Rhizobiaceae bacterium]